MTTQTPDYQHEFIHGSAIAPALYETAIEIVSDVEIDPITHEVLATPIADALNQRYTRFGEQAKASQTAALFKQETGEVWQAKVFGQRSGKRSGQYLAPKGNGNRAYFPAIDPATRAKLGAPQTGSFWDWVESNPTVPIVTTEGSKKSLAALTQGTVAIGLYGCDCGNSPDLERFLQPGRPLLIAFDQDSDRKTRTRVSHGIARLARRAIAAGCQVSIVQWSPSQGKGLDDLIAADGPAAWAKALADAVPYEAWLRSRTDAAILARLKNPLGKYKPDRTIDAADLCEAIKPGTVPTEGIVAILSGMGTGKTKLIARLIANDPAVIAPGHRESLQRGLGERLGLEYLHDTDSYRGRKIDREGERCLRLSLCFDSILAIDLNQYPPGSYVLVFDEADQGFWHVILGATCSKDGKRAAILERLEALIRGAKLVILASATLTNREIDYVVDIRSGEKPWILENKHQSLKYDCQFYSYQPGKKGGQKVARAMALDSLIGTIKEGWAIHVACDQIRTVKVIELIALNLGLTPDQILRYDGDTSTEERQRAFADKPNDWLAKNPIKLLITSPSLTSGVSIEIDHFKYVFGIFEAQTISPDDALQALGRVRKPVSRLIYAAAHGKGGDVPGFNALSYSGNLYKRSQLIAAAMGDQSILSAIDPTSPSARYQAQAAADRNSAMSSFGAYLAAALANEGAKVTRHEPSTELIVAIEQAQKLAKKDPEKFAEGLENWADGYREAHAAAIWAGALPEVRMLDALAKVESNKITPEEVKALRKKRSLILKERLELERFDICEFYQKDADDLNLDDVLLDGNGRYRAAIRRVEGFLWAGLSLTVDRAKLVKLTKWDLPVPQQDLPTGHLFCESSEKLGLFRFLAWAWDRTWTSKDPEVIALAESLLRDPDGTQMAIGYRPNPKQSPAAIVGMALTRLGLKTESDREGTGDRERSYSLTWKSRQDLKRVLQDRAKVHTAQGFQLRPHPLSQLLLEGVAVDENDGENSQLTPDLSPVEPAKIVPDRQKIPA